MSFSSKYVPILLVLAFVFALFHVSPASANNNQAPVFTSPAAASNFENFGDMSKASDLDQYAKNILKARADLDKQMYRSDGCSVGCSTGCSSGCSSGCSVGCSIGCSIGCK